MHSRLPSVRIPDEMLHDYIFGDLTPEASAGVALVDPATGSETTYRELRLQIAEFAKALSSIGVGRGDTVAVYLPNSRAYPVVVYGILESGAVATTVNAGYTADEVLHQLVDSGAKFLVARGAADGVACEAASRAGMPPERIIPEPDLSLAVMSTSPGKRPGPDPDQVALLPYSSGTAGGPKGVMLTHRNIVANVAQTQYLLGVAPTDTVLAVVPFAHIYGLSLALCTTLKNRARLIPLPQFDLLEYLSVIERYRCTFLFVSPPIALLLAKDPAVDAHDLGSVHTVFSGAAPLDGDLAAALERRLGCTVRQGYGMTELSPVSHLVPHGWNDIPAGSVGVLVPNSEQKLIDIDTGAEIEPPEQGISTPGELLFKGPNMMAGYLGNPDATRDTIDADGFLHTGDIATIGPGGIVKIVDRRKELIKVRGYQVAPAELEAVLLLHHKIADAAVTAMSDEYGNERPRAWVVVRNGEQLTAAEVRAFIDVRVTEYKRLGAVEFVDRIPKSPAGKILRKELAARPTPQGPRTLVDRSMAYFAGGAADPEMDPDSGLLANGFDSLTVIDLKNRLADHYGVEVTIAQLMRAPSLNHIVNRLVGGESAHQAVD